MEGTAQLLEEIILLILRRSEEISRLKQEYKSCNKDYPNIPLVLREAQTGRLSEKAQFFQSTHAIPPHARRVASRGGR
jgi:hypothetical protein